MHPMKNSLNDVIWRSRNPKLSVFWQQKTTLENEKKGETLKQGGSPIVLVWTT